jgi:hypothetical protein
MIGPIIAGGHSFREALFVLAVIVVFGIAIAKRSVLARSGHASNTS